MGWLDGMAKALARAPRSWRSVPQLLEAQRAMPDELQDDVARILDGVWPFSGLLLRVHQVGPIWYITYSKRKRYAWLHDGNVRQAESHDATVQGLLRTLPPDELEPWIGPLWQHIYNRPVLADEAARDEQLDGDGDYAPADEKLREVWHPPRLEDGELIFFAVAVTGIIKRVHCGRSVRFERVCSARRSKVPE